MLLRSAAITSRRIHRDRTQRVNQTCGYSGRAGWLLLSLVWVSRMTPETGNSSVLVDREAFVTTWPWSKYDAGAKCVRRNIGELERARARGGVPESNDAGSSR